MIKIITFEGADCTGKTSTSQFLASHLSGRKNLVFNSGLIYPTKEITEALKNSETINLHERELLFASAFASDANRSQTVYPTDDRIFIQDRYWLSAVYYGRFFNNGTSIYNNPDITKQYIPLNAVIHLTCSIEERRKRLTNRSNKPFSCTDRIILDDELEVRRLDSEIERSLAGLPRVLRIDTTNKTIKEVASKVYTFYEDLS